MNTINREKIIHVYYINKIIKNIQRINEANSVPLTLHDRRVQTVNQSYIKRWLDMADIFDESLQKEVVESCKSTNPEKTLEAKGWLIWG